MLVIYLLLCYIQKQLLTQQHTCVCLCACHYFNQSWWKDYTQKSQWVVVTSVIRFPLSHMHKMCIYLVYNLHEVAKKFGESGREASIMYISQQGSLMKGESKVKCSNITNVILITHQIHHGLFYFYCYLCDYYFCQTSKIGFRVPRTCENVVTYIYQLIHFLVVQYFGTDMHEW